jgi:DHA1 family bicyclomycin/chloramphenicol resistance-like MFS transporter
MNMVGIILAIAPAMSPAIGGITVKVAGWHSVFLLMVLFGLAIGATAVFALARDDRTRSLHAAAAAIATRLHHIAPNAEFLAASIVIACGIGVFYALATMLPFVLIEHRRPDSDPVRFSMLFQSGTFLFGSLVFRLLMRWWTPRQVVLPGLASFWPAASVSLSRRTCSARRC